MAIDASIYNNIRQVEVPNFADAQSKAMNLSNMAMQNKSLQSKMASDERDSQLEYAKKIQAATLPSMESLASLPELERAQAYPNVMKELEAQGIPMNNVPKDQSGNYMYDPQLFARSYNILKNSDFGMARQKSQAELTKLQNDPMVNPEDRALGRQKTLAEIANLNRKASGELDPYKMLMMQSLSEKLNENKLAKTPEGRMKAMSGEQKQRFDNAKLGLVATQGMSDALASGDKTFSIIGDNDFTQQRTLFEEALGRMQSGGAISKEEEKRFKGMAPTFLDSPEMKQKKLIQLRGEMESRLSTLGFSPQEIGINWTPKKVRTVKGQNSLGVSEAVAGDEKQSAPMQNAGSIISINNKMYKVRADGMAEEIKVPKK